jgi:probable F420-dependent oxidoreductase
VTPEHTRAARAILGADRWLCVEQMVVDQADATRAREIGRRGVSSYLTAPGYRANLERLGFSAAEMDAKSDRLVDALVAWGGFESIERRIAEHLEAGADHVCVQPFRADGEAGLDLELLERLAASEDVGVRATAG